MKTGRSFGEGLFPRNCSLQWGKQIGIKDWEIEGDVDCKVKTIWGAEAKNLALDNTFRDRS